VRGSDVVTVEASLRVVADLPLPLVPLALFIALLALGDEFGQALTRQAVGLAHASNRPFSVESEHVTLALLVPIGRLRHGFRGC
jgi:hypothetical protein